MNNQLIEKVIKSNDIPCPDFTFSNPLLDKNVARALSKSFVKILNVSKQNSNINNNLRLSILENIRKMCQLEPENHAKVDENFSELLTDFYQMQIKDATTNSGDAAEKELDAFLVRKMKEIDLNSAFESAVNPEIVQALLNLNESGVYFETLSRDIINWDNKSNIYKTVLQDMWNDCIMSDNVSEERTFNDISIKMKPEIERMLLETCQIILANNTDVEVVITSNESLMNLIKSFPFSSESFQICSGILNFLFIMTNFDQNLQKFISAFVKHVKIHCPPVKFSMLYPMHLASIVVLLDFDIDNMPLEMKEHYIKLTLRFMLQLHRDSENDFVLLLSHFPQWFDIYFKTEDHEG